MAQVRCYERAEFAAAFMKTAEGAVVSLHDYTTALVEGDIPHTGPRVTYYNDERPGGSSTCPSADIGGAASKRTSTLPR